MLDKVNWPEPNHPRNSAIYSLNEIEMDAPPEVVWRLLIDAENWPSYYPHAEDVKIVTGEPQLAPGAKYTWRTAGMQFVCVVREFVPTRRIGWNAYFTEGGEASSTYHGWVITPTAGGGTHVLTEETQRGPDFLELARTHPGVLWQVHQDWVENLARTAEAEVAKPAG